MPIELRVTPREPLSDSNLRGVIDFDITLSGLSSPVSIEYFLNGHSLSGPLTPPSYRFSWNSALTWDGRVAFQAVARNTSGVEIGRSLVQWFSVKNNNYGGILLLSPVLHEDMHNFVSSDPLNGIVDLTVQAERTDGLDRGTMQFTLWIDGQYQHWYTVTSGDLGGNLSVRYWKPLDTTKFSNGVHELLVKAIPDPLLPPGCNNPPRPPPCMVQRQVMIQNARAVLELRPQWAILYLVQPGASAGPTSANLPLWVIYNDGSRELYTGPATYSILSPPNTTGDTYAATVDERGMVQAVANGITICRAEAVIGGQVYQADTWIFVDAPDRGFPHFSRDGHILQVYEPDRSLFVRTLFNLAPSEFRHVGARPDLADQLHAAAVNALTTGFYQSPADNPTSYPPTDPPEMNLSNWRTRYESWWSPSERAASETGFCLVLVGDDIARTKAEMYDSVTYEWVKQTIQEAFARIWDSGRAICVDMVDEVSYCWYDTPTPSDGRWLAPPNPIPDDAFISLMSFINKVPCRTPISWPVGADAVHPDADHTVPSWMAAQNWMGNPAFADYASIYWTTQDDPDIAYPDRRSLPRVQYWADDHVMGWTPFLQRNAPSLMLSPLAGSYYCKRGPGDQYTAGQDELWDPGFDPLSCAAMVMYAVARGQTGVRAYAYDWSGWKYEREQPASGAPLQTGADPFVVNTDLWQAMSSAFNLVRRLEPYLLQPQMHALHLGDTITTGAHQGPNSRLLIAINFLEAEQTRQVDLSYYRLGDHGSFTRFRLIGATLTTEIVTDREVDDVTFAPGETIVWLWQTASGESRLDAPSLSIRFHQPLPNATVSGLLHVSVECSDEVSAAGIDRVEFFADGHLIGTRTPREPLEVTWDTTAVPDEGKWHSLSALAYDRANISSEARLSVRVQQPLPPLHVHRYDLGQLVTGLADGPIYVIGPGGKVPVDPGPIGEQARAAYRQIADGLAMLAALPEGTLQEQLTTPESLEAYRFINQGLLQLRALGRQLAD